jgi:Tfp pilus assembly protein PilN
MIEINLVPDVKLKLLRANRQRRLVISAAIMVAIVAGGAVALLAFYAFGVQTIAGGLADNSITSENKKLQGVKDLAKTLTIQNQLKQLASLHEDKNVTSRLFDILSATVPTGKNAISITQLAFDGEENTITIEGKAQNGYEALEVFKKTIAQTIFKYSQDGQTQEPVNIADSISEGERRYTEDSDGNRVLTFELSFTYPDELFLPTSQQGKIVAPTKQRATDSAVGVPASLFSGLEEDQ